MSGLRFMVTVATIVLMATIAGAQSVGTVYLGGTTGEVIAITTDGSSITTVVTGAQTGARFMNALTIGVDNQRFVAADEFASTGSRLLEIDAVTSTVTSVIWAETRGPSIASINYLQSDQDGNYLISAGADIFKVSWNGVFSSFFNNPGISYDAFAEDKTTGNWLLGDKTTVGSRMIHVLDRATMSIITMATLGVPTAIAMHQDPHTELVYCAGGSFPNVQVYRPSTNAVSTLVNDSQLSNAMAIDRAPDSNGGIFYLATTARAGAALFRYDRNGTNLGKVASYPAGFTVLSATFAERRNLAPTLIAGPNQRTIRINFPGDTGKGYVLAASATGYTTGFSVGGQHIPLDFDAVTAVTATGSVPGIFTQNIGTLGAGGVAQATLDFNPFGAAAKGIKIWLAGVSYDQNGISQVSAPLLVVMD